MNLAELREKVAPQIRQLLNKEPECISSIEKTNEGWKVLCDVLDKKAVPETFDILKVYEFMIDKDVKVASFKQLRKIRRGDIGDSN